MNFWTLIKKAVQVPLDWNESTLNHFKSKKLFSQFIASSSTQQATKRGFKLQLYSNHPKFNGSIQDLQHKLGPSYADSECPLTNGQPPLFLG